MTPKNPAAVALGRRGGHARAKKMTAEERAESARKASEARWAHLKKVADEITEGTKRLEEKIAARKKKSPPLK